MNRDFPIFDIRTPIYICVIIFVYLQAFLAEVTKFSIDNLIPVLARIHTHTRRPHTLQGGSKGKYNFEAGIPIGYYCCSK